MIIKNRDKTGMAIAGLLFLLTILGAGKIALLAQNSNPLAKADKLYQEKSFALALKEYQRVTAAGKVPLSRREEVQYRILVSLGRSQQRNRSLSETLNFTKANAGTVWEARGLYWLGRLYLGVEHGGYRVGGKLTRGKDVPKTTGNQKPLQVYRAPLDEQDSREAFEAAVTLYSSKKFVGTSEEEILLDLDLLSILANDPRFQKWGVKQDWVPLKPDTWRIDPKQPFDPAWPYPKKNLYLFSHIEALGKSPQAHATALALFAKAQWIANYQTTMSRTYALKWEGEKLVPIPYPYQDLKEDEVWKALISQFPNDPIHDMAVLGRANSYVNRQNPSMALVILRDFLKSRPQSKFVSDAKAVIQQILRPQITVMVPNSILAGSEIKASVYTTNVDRLHFALYPLDLKTLLLSKTDRYQSDWNTLSAQNGDPKRFLKSLGMPIKEWDLKVSSNGDHLSNCKDLNLSVPPEGSYILAVSSSGVTALKILNPTRLTLVQRTDRTRCLLFAADSITGKALKGVEITARIWYYDNKLQIEKNYTQDGKTNEAGLLSFSIPANPNRTNYQVGAIGTYQRGLAFTNSTWLNEFSQTPEGLKAYCTTDRAVYRPLQTVFYRELVMQNLRSGLTPAKGKKLNFSVTDPAGKVIYKDALTTSEFGSVNGKFELSKETPLGEYQISFENEGETSGNSFRVEEYKKPEFEVTVTPEIERLKLGQKATATVKASYYFGGPVPNATVTYRIHRNEYNQTFAFPRPYDFLYGGGDAGSNEFRSGAVILQGVAKTDAKGEAKISFETKANPAVKQSEDLAFTIEADVKDSSRRTITGSGTVKATRHDVSVFLDFPHGYATAGDRVDVEIATRNPSDKPVSVEGAAKVFLVSDNPKKKETLVHEEPMLTDKEGRAFLKWRSEKAGYYRVAFVTRDSEGRETEGSLFLFVNGKELANGHFQFQGLFLGVKELTYQEGESAKILLVSQEPDCDVLLTREADSLIMEKSVIHLKGRSLELTLPLSHRDSPNVFFSAIAVKKGEVLQATQEVFVPPVSQLAKIEISSEQAHYHPGEKAKFKLTAKDFQGRPLRTELAISLTDASLNYIQKRSAADIRVFYYGNRRTDEVQSSLSNGVNLEELHVDTTSETEYEDHSYDPFANIGLLQEWPGKPRNGYGIGGWRLPNPRKAKAFGKSRSLGDINGYAGDGSKAAMPVSSDRLGGYAPPGRAVAAPKAPYVFDQTAPVRSGLSGEGVRTRFSDTAFWSPAVVTNSEGVAEVEVALPDNLTRWHALTNGNTTQAQVGTGETDITTKKELLVRLEAPRFFVERDRMTVSGIVQNSTDSERSAEVSLDLGGESLALADSSRKHSTILVPANGEKRVDWEIEVRHPGEAALRLSAKSESLNDATELSFPVLIHGIERAITKTGVVQDGKPERVEIELPEARKAGTSETVVHLTPSLASVMLDALPYLNDYPYGCVEQTMSRFLPSVLTASTLKTQGIDLEALRVRAQKLKEEAKQGRGNLQIENSPYSYSTFKPGTEPTPIEPWNRPVFSAAALNRMLKDGISRLRDFQHADGGWAWWKEGDSDPYMSAYVLYGLQLATKSGIQMEGIRLDDGLDFLGKRFKSEKSDLDLLAYEARVLSMSAGRRDAIRGRVSGELYDNREKLSDYSKGLLILALKALGENDKAATLLRNLQNTIKIDEDNGTAHWEVSNRFWWRWYNDSIETNATLLEAILASDPNSRLAPMLVKWLVNHRKGAHWETTRETALTVFALSEYVKIKKELSADYTLKVALGDQISRTYRVTPQNALLFDNRFVIPDAALESGKQTLTITKTGKGACYFSSTTRFFSQEEGIPAGGNEIFVERKYFKLLAGTASGEPEDVELDLFRENPFLSGKLNLLDSGETIAGEQDIDAGPRYDRVAIGEGETVSSGDLIEVELQLDAKNDYDYVLFEDLKPAGCEPVEVRSGGKVQASLYSNLELRDQKVSFFITNLPQGNSTLSYRLRAESPGRFHVLPTNGYAMYAPDVRANSAERTIGVKE